MRRILACCCLGSLEEIFVQFDSPLGVLTTSQCRMQLKVQDFLRSFCPELQVVSWPRHVAQAARQQDVLQAEEEEEACRAVVVVFMMP